jgi:hypothetical protein
MSEVTAADAMAHAEAAHIKVQAHEDLCAERYAHIQTNIAGVKDSVSTVVKLVGWGGSTMFLIIMSLLAFFASRAVSNNDGEINQLKAQVEVLQAKK